MNHSPQVPAEHPPSAAVVHADLEGRLRSRRATLTACSQIVLLACVTFFSVRTVDRMRDVAQAAIDRDSRAGLHAEPTVEVARRLRELSDRIDAAIERLESDERAPRHDQERTHERRRRPKSDGCDMPIEDSPPDVPGGGSSVPPVAPRPGCLLRNNAQDAPDPAVFGAWNSVIPESDGAADGNILGMHTVHNAMLPSGKILLVSGSCWRNLAPVQYYPKYDPPIAPTGCFVRDSDPFLDSKLSTYYQLVNYAAVFDPAKNTFYRIPVPVPECDPDQPGHFAPNDFFCTGHQHLPDGNVLFAGGTQYYTPFRTGNRSTYVFDWRRELKIPWAKVDWRQVPGPRDATPWDFAGFMTRGRWYPSLVPLLDGRLALFSGFVGFDAGFPAMYQFEINHFVEFFDPSAFDRRHPEAAWRAVDVKKTPNSPFTVEINPTFKPTPNVDCDDRCREDNRFDAFKLYPENYLMPDGRIYLTREGDWVSLRTCDTAFMRRTKRTYWAAVGGTAASPTVSFSPGPDRAEEITSYGTSFLDPATGDIHILGGQPTSPGTLYPLSASAPTHFAGGRGSRKLETFHPGSGPLGGEWTLTPDFLGDQPQDDRTMHYAIILPTRQILVTGGGNYDFYGPVNYPLLLTPKTDANGAFAGYDRRRMAEAVEPRLYHNAATLLPDGRIFVSGGNSARATVRTAVIPPADPRRIGQPLPDLGLVDNDVYFYDDGPVARAKKGMLSTPTENWTAEYYSPPYLFIDPKRRAAIESIQPVEPTDYAPSVELGDRTYYLFHSDRKYRMALTGLPAAGPGQKASLVLLKLPSVTHGWQNGQHFISLPFEASGESPSRIEFQTPNARLANVPPGYYMLFYVDGHGKPSIAQMVRFDDNAKEP